MREERLAEQTCDLLNIEQLKAVCRYRGFNPPSSQKEALASFVAPRLLEPTGVAKAMASLEEQWLLVLHSIAMAQDAPNLDRLYPVVRTVTRSRSYSSDHRGMFRLLAQNLINRGLVLLEDPLSFTVRGLSRFARCRFHLAACHRPFLPPFPVPTQTPGQRPETGNLHTFCIDALKAAVRHASDSGTASPTGLLGRIASRITFDDGRLGWKKSGALDWPTYSRQARSEWVQGPSDSGKARSPGPAFRAAEHILFHLPPGAGTTVEDLKNAVEGLGIRPDTVAENQLSLFCQDGYAAGLLWRGGDKASRCYAGATRRDADADRALSFRPTKEGITVDLDRSGLQPLLELAAVSRVQAVEGNLRLEPDVLLLGRAAKNLKAMAPLRDVRSASAPFDRAARHVEEKHGTLFLHEGLVVLRIEDLGFRTLLAHELSDIRALGGPYLAAPRGLLTYVEELAHREGFAPRKMT